MYDITLYDEEKEVMISTRANTFHDYKILISNLDSKYTLINTEVIELEQVELKDLYKTPSGELVTGDNEQQEG